MGFVENFIRFPAMQKCEHRLRYDKVTESIKVGTFLRHSVVGIRACKITSLCVEQLRFLLPRLTCTDTHPPERTDSLHCSPV